MPDQVSFFCGKMVQEMKKIWEGIMKCREIAENTKLETLSWHFYDIYYSLSGGELESSRDEIYIKA